MRIGDDVKPTRGGDSGVGKMQDGSPPPEWTFAKVFSPSLATTNKLLRTQPLPEPSLLHYLWVVIYNFRGDPLGCLYTQGRCLTLGKAGSCAGRDPDSRLDDLGRSEDNAHGQLHPRWR